MTQRDAAAILPWFYAGVGVTIPDTPEPLLLRKHLLEQPDPGVEEWSITQWAYDEVIRIANRTPDSVSQPTITLEGSP